VSALWELAVLLHDRCHTAIAAGFRAMVVIGNRVVIVARAHSEGSCPVEVRPTAWRPWSSTVSAALAFVQVKDEVAVVVALHVEAVVDLRPDQHAIAWPLPKPGTAPNP
jgi:CTP:molybdopterin cytidylyltransferase MocA